MGSTAKRWFSLAIGSAMMLILGLVYAWSVFVAPLEAEFGWARSQTSLTFTVCMVCFIIGLLSCGILTKWLSRRLITIIGAACLFIGFALSSRIDTLVGLYISYGVLIGFGVGITNNALVSTLVKWFPDRAGLASGVLMMGFGLGGMILGPLAASLMSTVGWRSTFFGFGVVFSVILALGSFIVILPPEGYNVASASGKRASAAEGGLELPASKVMRRKSYWVYMLWFLFVMAGGLLVIGHASPYVQSLGALPSLAAVATGTLSLSNGAGRVLTGATYDRFGLRVSMLMMNIYMIIAAALLLLSSVLGSLPLVFAGFVFTGLSYGGGPATASTFALSFYGKENFAMNYSVLSAGMAPAAILGPMLAAWLYESSGGYTTSLSGMLVFAVLSVLALRLIKKP